ncbi:MAG: hypothetical protein WD874_00305, partial [Parcubacteria group bacterium]
MFYELISILKDGVGPILNAILPLAPIWVPLMFIVIWWDLWINYKRRLYIQGQGSTLLEIKIPREMMKSPQAVELFLNNIYHIGVGNLIKVYWEGSVRPWYSLEIVSMGGAVKFFIWMPKNYKNRVETQLYAQMPNVEVHEVPDYALGIHRNPEQYTFGWFGQFALTKDDVYPIKTYIDYGLADDPKEEFKHDPIVAFLEFMGSLKKGEQAWLQILIQGHTKEGLKLGRIFSRPDWQKAAEKEIKEIIKKNAPKMGEGREPLLRDISTGHQDVIKALERTTGKVAFDTMMRGTYFAEKEVFNPTNTGGFIGSIAQFGSPALNGFKPGWTAGYDYPWQDFRGNKKARNERVALEAYKRRSFFNPPFKNFRGRPFVLSTEEL